MSTHCTRQENGFDCGVFTILSSALIAKGVPMSNVTYTQAVVDHVNVRDRMANIILDSIPPESTLLANWLRQPSTLTAPPAQSTAGQRRPAKRARTTLTSDATCVAAPPAAPCRKSPCLKLGSLERALALSLDEAVWRESSDDESDDDDVSLLSSSSSFASSSDTASTSSSLQSDDDDRISSSPHRYFDRAEYNSRSLEPIRVEHIMTLGLRVMGGGRPKDIRHFAGTSRAASYKAVNDFLNAVNETPELSINFPSGEAEWETVRRGWTAKSSSGLLHGNLLALDGFFQRTNMPTRKEASNVLSYYSGHYEHYRINCQAAIQSDLQFVYFGVISPGSTNDNISYPKCKVLTEIIDNLPTGLYAHDTFNYYLSQLRIRVEMAFGRLVNKFRILGGKVEGSLDRVSAILEACSRLHNFIIQVDGPFDTKVYSAVEEEMESLEIVANPIAPLGMSYLPVVPDETFEAYPGVSHTRDAIVEFIREQPMGRPCTTSSAVGRN
ncbi:hypothetical protein ACHAWF_016576 [Thalassiosira exigua]